MVPHKEVHHGVLVISHGSRDQGWVRLVDEVVAQVSLPTGVQMYSSFLELVDGRLIQDGIDHLQAQGVTDILVVPLFISSGSTHVDEIRYALGDLEQPQLETDLQPFAIRARVRVTSPIDDDPIIAQILYANIQDLSDSPAQEIVLVVGHGSIQKGFHLRWRRGLERLATRIQQLGGFAEADVAMLLPDQIERKMKWWRTRRPDLTVIVVPLFLSEGYYTRKVIPARLAQYPHRYHGRTLLPNHSIASWMEQQLEPFLQSSDK